MRLFPRMSRAQVEVKRREHRSKSVMDDHNYFSRPAKYDPAQYAAKMSKASQVNWEVEGLRLIQQGLSRLTHNTRARLLDPPGNRVDWLGDLIAELEAKARDI